MTAHPATMTSIRLDDELRDRLDDYMNRTGATLTATIHIALELFLHGQQEVEDLKEEVKRLTHLLDNPEPPDDRSWS